MTTRTTIGNGVYQDASGFWVRPRINGRRTWRRLSSTTRAEALQEAGALLADHARSKLGLVRDPWAAPMPTVAEAAKTLGRLLCPRILATFGAMPLGDVTMAAANEYGAARTATRSADLEIASLSALLSASVARGWIRVNPLLGRGHFHAGHKIRHAREVMPADGGEIHLLARALFASPQSEGVGWQLLIQAMTGCRTNELLALRMDATGKTTPGWIEGRYLYVRRAKGGRFPFVELHAALREAIRIHHAWHARRYPHSPYWFPGADGVTPLNRVALTHALARVSEAKRTSHGLRAYYVTACRSQGEGDAQVAARIGDSTAALIGSTYGALPEVWAGGKPLTWMPPDGTAPAWAMLGLETVENVVQFDAGPEALPAISPELLFMVGPAS